jgi:hypothetical protein
MWPGVSSEVFDGRNYNSHPGADHAALILGPHPCSAGHEEAGLGDLLQRMGVLHGSGTSTHCRSRRVAPLLAISVLWSRKTRRICLV